jgi:hypothetical protein
MEKVGIHKRDIMVDRVVDAKESQQDAQVQFKSALAEMTALINFDGGDLEELKHKVGRDVLILSRMDWFGGHEFRCSSKKSSVNPLISSDNATSSF